MSDERERISAALDLCCAGEFSEALAVLRKPVRRLKGATRCPDCGEARCDEDCPSRT